MQPYRNLSGKSGVAAFEIGDDFVKVLFRDNPRIYLYSTPPIAAAKIEQMKGLALVGRGLATFISQNPDVRAGFS